MNQIELATDYTITKVGALQKDGSYAQRNFHQEGKKLVIYQREEPAYPVILVMEKE